jgi:hypothetical protein
MPQLANDTAPCGGRNVRTRTKQAVERYQKHFQLKAADGVVGPE